MERRARYAIAAVVVGAFGAAFGIAFRLALHHGLQLLTGTNDVLAAFAAMPLWERLLLPAAGGGLAAAVGLVAVQTEGGHGVAEILEAVVLGRGVIRLKTVLLKAVASLVALVSGASIGREGSIIQMGAGSGSTLGRLLRLPEKETRMLVAAGAGAGFAAAYNTPIAAVLFVVEVVTGVLGLDVFLPAAIAVATSTTLTRLAIGGGPIYGQREFALVSQEELIAYCVLGVLAGVLGPGFMEALSRAERLVHGVQLPRMARGALGGLAVGALAIFLPQITGNGYEAIQLILDARIGAALLAVLLFAKAAATIASVSSGSPGGVFTPSLFLGAALGGLVGATVPHLLVRHASTAAAGGYALAGMAAMIASTTHAPLMAVALGFELSGDYSIVIPTLLCTAVAAVFSRTLRPESIYTAELRQRGIPWRGTVSERLARAVSARDILTADPPQVAPTAPIAEALALLALPGVRVVYVPGKPLRAIDLHQAKRALRGEIHGAAEAASVAHEVATVRPEDTLLDLSEKLWTTEWGEVPVCEGGRLTGVVTRRALLGAMDREILHRDVLLTRVVSFDGQTESGAFLELPKGRRAEEIPAPLWLTGLPLDRFALHERFGVLVVALRAGRTGVTEDPAQDAVVSRGDRLLVIGTPEGIARLRTTA